MPYYKDPQNNIHFLESVEFESVLPEGCTPIADEDVQPAATTSTISVTPWQIRKALNQLGLRASVEAAVAASSQEVKDGWEFASEFRSDNELIAQLCTALGKTEVERLALFQLAATL